MRVNKNAVKGIFCKNLGKWPSEYEAERQAGRIMVSDVVEQCRIEILENPLTAEAILETLFPGLKVRQREEKNQSANNQMIAFIKRQKQKEVR